MSLILRGSLNRRLTETELDQNFTYLEGISGGTGGGSGPQAPTLIETEAHGLSVADLGKVIFFDATGTPKLYEIDLSGQHPNEPMPLGILMGVPSPTSIELNSSNHVLVKKKAGEFWVAADLTGVADPMGMGYPSSVVLVGDGGEAEKSTGVDQSEMGIGVALQPALVGDTHVLVSLMSK